MAKATNIIEEIERTLSSCRTRLAELEQALAEANTMRFKEGDVAFHKSYGNCLVVHVLVASYPRNDLNLGRESMDLTGYYIAMREGNACVKEKELMPITEVAKTLYSKS